MNEFIQEVINGKVLIDYAELAALRERLAEAERERDWFHLLAYAVLGHSISTYEVADQTIAIYSATEMVWADWEPHGESDEKTGLPKETAELRAKIEAAVESHRPVEDVQGARIKLAEEKRRATALEATLAAIRESLTQYVTPERYASGLLRIHELVNGEKS